MTTVSITAEPAHDAALRAKAAALAEELGLELAADAASVRTPMALVCTPERLELRVLVGESGLIAGRPLAIDLTRLRTGSGPGGRLAQPLLRAVGVRRGEARPSVLDATAGLGEDAWLLASAGCQVTAVERSPVAAALLRDAVTRARGREPLTAMRLRVIVGDSVAILRALPGCAAPDVAYLDPMFPAQRKALQRKPLRVLRALVGDDRQAEALLTAALATARRRVVVKRPGHAPPLDGRKPVSSHRGRAVRYDVYSPRAVG